MGSSRPARFPTSPIRNVATAVSQYPRRQKLNALRTVQELLVSAQGSPSSGAKHQCLPLLEPLVLSNDNRLTINGRARVVARFFSIHYVRLC